MLIVTLSWITCDGLASHPGGVVMLIVTLSWVSCAGLASHPGGSCDANSHFMLQKLDLCPGSGQSAGLDTGLPYHLSGLDYSEKTRLKCIHTSFTSACPVNTFSHVSATLQC